MRHAENVREVADLKPDYLGFIFYKDSKRYVGDIDLNILNDIPSEIIKTGVFVNAGYDEIVGIARKYKLDAVQLHGYESPELSRKLKDQGLEVIKAFGIDEIIDFRILEPYLDAVDHFLFDTKVQGYGGSGKKFDWKLLEKYTYKVSYFLSGGISQENLSEIKHIEDERLYAVDLNSQFEMEPGIKDVEKVKEAIDYIRN